MTAVIHWRDGSLRPRKLTAAAVWDESLHPRDEHGRFGESDGSGLEQLVPLPHGEPGAPNEGDEHRATMVLSMQQAMDAAASPTPRNFIAISNPGETLSGMKLHIRADDADDVRAVVYRLYDDVRDYGLAMKIATPAFHEMAAGHPTQEGKGVTIYLPERETAGRDAANIIQDLNDYGNTGEIHGDQMIAPGIGYRYELSIDPGRDVSLDDYHRLYEPARPDKTPADLFGPSRGKVEVIGPAMSAIEDGRATFDWNEEAHPRDSHGRFGDKGDDTGEVVGTPWIAPTDIHPSDAHIERAAEAWGGWRETTEARYAAEIMLGKDHPTSAEFEDQATARWDVLNLLDGDPSVGEKPDANELAVSSAGRGAQEAVDTAYDLLYGVRDAPPSDLPLFRGVSMFRDDPGSAALAALKPGDTFDLSLASFSHDYQTAQSFTNPDAPDRVIFRLEPGAKGVPGPGTETEVQNAQKEWVPGYNDVIVGGRIEITKAFYDRMSRTRILNARQVGVFDPEHGGKLVPNGD